MTEIVNHQSTIENPLWHFLQRVPPEEALLRASEARLINALSLSEPCLDLRDEFGRNTHAKSQTDSHASIILTTTEPFAGTLNHCLHEAKRALNGNGQLVVFVDGEMNSAETHAAYFHATGLTVVKWQPYFSQQAQAASDKLKQNRAHLWHELTGHYVPLPWKRFLQPLDDYLRPYFDNPSTENCGKLMFVLCKSSDDAMQPLPEPVSLASKPPSSPPATPTASPLTQQSVQPLPTAATAPPASISKGAALPVALTSAALLFAFIAQSMMRAQPFTTGYGLSALLAGFVALAGLLLVKRPESTAPDFGFVAHYFTAVYLTRAAIYGFAILFALLAAARSDSAGIGVSLWALAIGLAGYALWKKDVLLPSPTAAEKNKISVSSALFRWENAAIGMIVLAALLLRYWRLTQHPWMLSGIEAQLGLEGMGVQDLFAVGWLTNPTLPMFFTKGMVLVFGRTALALRILSPLIGTAAVVAIYAVGKRLWSTQVGLLAALLLTFSHTHIHYSRLGMSNIWDPLLLLLALGGIASAWQSNKRTHWLTAGAAIGLSAYFYTALHLLPLMLLGLALWALVAKKGATDSADSTGENTESRVKLVLVAALFALVIALPQMRFFQQNPALFMERVTLLGIEQTGWVDGEMARSGSSRGTVYARQLWQAALSYNALLDRDSSFNPDMPLVNSFVGVFFLLGLGIAIFHIRQIRYAILLIAFLVTITFGGALLIELPTSRRLLIALPIVMLIAAHAAVWLGDKLSSVRSQRSASSSQPESHTSKLPSLRLTQHAALCLALIFGLLNVSHYFTTYQTAHRFGDRNTEIAHAVGTYLNELEGDWTVYFHAAPQMYVSAPTITFLATEFQNGVNLHDVAEGIALPEPSSSNVAHIFTPDHFDAFGRFQSQSPNGSVEAVEGFYANPLFVSYKLTQP